MLNPHKKAKPAQPPVQPTPPTQKAREISKEEKTKSDHHHHTSSRKESKRRSKKTHSKKYVDTSTDEEEGDNDDSDGKDIDFFTFVSCLFTNTKFPKKWIFQVQCSKLLEQVNSELFYSYLPMQCYGFFV